MVFDPRNGFQLDDNEIPFHTSSDRKLKLIGALRHLYFANIVATVRRAKRRKAVIEISQRKASVLEQFPALLSTLEQPGVTH